MSMSQKEIASAAALYSLADEYSLTDRLLEELQVLQAAFADQPDYLRLLDSHTLTKQERLALLDEGFAGRVHPYLLSFMKLLTEKNAMRSFGGCCRAYTAQYNAAHGILPVTVLTALPLTEAQAARLQEKLETVTGKRVQLTGKVDAACMGGVRLDYDGRQVDDTVAHRLAALRDQMKNTVL